MLLKVAYVPELAERLVIILDDRSEVWQSDSDQRLVRMYPVRQQLYVTSDRSNSPWLQRFISLALRMHELAFSQGYPTRTLPDIYASELAVERLRNHMRSW